MKLLPSCLFAAVLALSACATTPGHAPASTTASLQGDAARPAAARGWVRSELYFGVGEETGPADRPQTRTISDAQWRAFWTRK